MRISVSIVREKSFDPDFTVRVSYKDENVSFKNAIVKVTRRPPRVTIDYPENIKSLLSKINVKKLELEIMNKIVEFLLG